MPTEVLNPFVPNAPFLYPLKTSEIRKVFWCFHGVEKGSIGNEWVKFWKSDVYYIYLFVIWFIADLTSPNPAQNYVFNVENKNTR